MNNAKRNAALALVGLLALTIYILACTSFSPDDTKVLYPAFDQPSGAIAMAVYDRETRTSEMLFVPVVYETNDAKLEVAPALLRAQWLANGRDIVLASVPPRDNDKSGLDVAVIPWGARKPIRLFQVPGLKDAGQAFAVPLCLAGERVFFAASPKSIVRLDLRSGALAFHEFPEAKGELAFYPAPDGTCVYYFGADDPAGEQTTFGRLNPNDFALTPLMVISNSVSQPTALAYDPEGKVVALLTGGEGKAALQIWREGKVAFSREVATPGHKLTFGNILLATSGKALWASFQQANGTNSMSYGLMEIPFSEAPTHQELLIKDAPVQDEPSADYFQVAVSHDGKAAALSSAYLALMERPIKPSDCALFLVDVSQPSWKVTKVPIPVPAKLPTGVK